MDDSFIIFAAGSHQFYSANEGVVDKPSYDQMFNLRVDHSISNTQHAFARYSQEWNKQTWQGCGGTATWPRAQSSAASCAKGPQDADSCRRAKTQGFVANG